MNILLLEDEKNIRQVLELNLSDRGHEVHSYGNGLSALKAIEQIHFDVAILDIMLPDITGYEVCQRLKLLKPELPVLFLSAKDQSGDRIKGLQLGADDYLTKPFDVEELVLRLQNIQRRYHIEEREQFSFGGNTIYYDELKATTYDGSTINLTKKEIELLKLFSLHIGKALSRQDILHLVWGYDIYPTTRTIDNFILNFRKYFEKNPKEPNHFISIRGVGYKFLM